MEAYINLHFLCHWITTTQGLLVKLLNICVQVLTLILARSSKFCQSELCFNASKFGVE